MKKRILTLVAALAVAATTVAPVNAETLPSSQELDKYFYYNAKGEPTDANGNVLASGDKLVFKSGDQKKTVDKIVDTHTEVKSANSDLKPSGAANAKVNVVTGNAKDNLMDNGIKPCVKEFVKATEERKAGKANIGNIKGIHYFDLTADQTGDVTFKIDDDMNEKAMDGDSYAIVLHYTGNAADEDGITAQYCKISSAGKVTAHFNSFSPVSIIATNVHSAQTLVNTYSHSAGSDAGSASATTTTTTTATPVVDPAAQQVAPVDPNAAAAANAKGAGAGTGAASPKTSDNAYALYLILAVAAVAGTTLVATKKTR
jgi:hypothetical protein